MNRVIKGAILLLAMTGTSFAQSLTQVGTWQGGNLYAYTILIQGKDDNFMLPRGGNFIQNDMAKIDPRFGNTLKELLGNGHTENGGLEQPDPNEIPVPVNYDRVWVVDEQYLVYGYALKKKGTNPGFPVYNTVEEAIAKIEQLKAKAVDLPEAVMVERLVMTPKSTFQAPMVTVLTNINISHSPESPSMLRKV